MTAYINFFSHLFAFLTLQLYFNFCFHIDLLLSWATSMFKIKEFLAKQRELVIIHHLPSQY